MLSELALESKTRSRVETWLTNRRFKSQREALEQLVSSAAGGDADALAELEDAFARTLPIGTGGRRGPVGPGPNRINDVVIRETAIGVVQALKREGAPEKVAILYDTRAGSRRFALEVSVLLAHYDVDSLLVDAPRPTPQLSHIVRTRGCGYGIVISASHNPPGDNGIKIYGPDGAQVLGDRDAMLMKAILAAADMPLPEVSSEAIAGHMQRIDPERDPDSVDRPYHRYVLEQGVLAGDLSDAGLKVVFTPLHGVGHTSVVPVLTARGIDVSCVAAQVDPDGGRFSTVKSANPESPDSFEMARAQAEAEGADLVLATDPDADRLGALVRASDGSYPFVDGNRLGVLMAAHVLDNVDLARAKAEGGRVVTTVVTTPLIPALARRAGLEVVDDILVGFKHHAGVVAERPDAPLVYACEESHGYVRGNEIRDKDGCIAALLLAEAAVAAKREGKTLFDRLREVWSQEGYHREKTANLWAPGEQGRAAIAHAMASVRREPPEQVGGLTRVGFEDRLEPRDTGSSTRDLPGNVLVFSLAKGDSACKLVLRPSGTEPKMKVYALARGEAGLQGAALDESVSKVDALVNAVLEDMRARVNAIMAPMIS